MPVQLLTSLLADFLPRPLLQGSRLQRLHLLQRPTPGTNDERFWALELPISLLQSTLREALTVDARIHYRVDVAHLALTVEGDTVEVTADLDFALRTAICFAGREWEVLRWGTGNLRPRVCLTLRSRMLWQQNGQVAFPEKDWELEWLVAAPPAGLPIDPVELLQVPQIQSQFERFLDNLVTSGTPGQYSVYRLLEKRIQRLYRPFRVRDQVWLNLQPHAITVFGLRGEEEKLVTQLAIHCEPQVTYGDMPPPTPWVPPTVLTAPVSTGFRANLLVQTGYAELEEGLTKALSQRNAWLQQYQLEVGNVHVAGDLNSVRIRLYFKRPVRALLYLEGLPLYSFYQRRVQIRGLDYRIVSGKGWVRTLDRLLHPLIQRMLAPRVVFQLDETVNRLRTVLANIAVHEQLNDKVDLHLTGKMDNFEVQNVYFDSAGLSAQVAVSGELDLSFD